MKKKITRKKHTISAQGKPLGRLAVEVAKILIGKHKLPYEPHVDKGDYVIVVNTDKVKISGRKLDDKIYYHHSMYPGGLRKTKMKDVFFKDPAWVLRHAISNMLPKNSFRKKFLKRLTIN